MSTRRIESPNEAAQIIREGGLVAFPTETVFGLGADATNPVAIDKLFAAKGRPSDNPLIVHLADREQWPGAAARITPHAETLLAAFAPGPITVVLPKHPQICSRVTAGMDTVGVRVPSHPLAREILRQASVPVAAPSANRSGRPSGTTWKAVLEDLDGRIEGVFCGDTPSIGIESTVIDCCGPVPILLRPGAITMKQIRSVVPEAQPRAVDLPSPGCGSVKSPGLLHPHYQPRARVRLIEDLESAVETDHVAERTAFCGTERFSGMERLALTAVFPTLEAYAAGFYEFLREVDRRCLTLVIVQAAPDRGIGSALLDRQRRAAGIS